MKHGILYEALVGFQRCAIDSNYTSSSLECVRNFLRKASGVVQGKRGQRGESPHEKNF